VEEDVKKRTDAIHFGAFFGVQVFKVGDSDFSGDYPIVGFARELFAIASNLKHFGKTGFYEDPECESGTFLEFSLTGEAVTIKKISVKTEEVVCSATIALDVLLKGASEYLEHVVQHFSIAVPELLSPDIQEWLWDFSMPGWKGTL